MMISDLLKDTLVSISVVGNNRRIRLDTKVVDVTFDDIEYMKKVAVQSSFKSFIALDLVKDGNKVINFVSANINCYITAQVYGKPYRWKGVKILKLNLPSKGYLHVAFCNDEAESFNRREEFRLWLGYEADFKLNDSQVPHECIIKDLSKHGGSFILDSKYEVKVNDVLHIQFYDKFKNGTNGDWKKVLHSLIYNVVRVTRIKNNRLLLGCSLVGEDKDLFKFLAKKQREKISVGGRNSLYRHDSDTKLAETLSNNDKED